MRQPTPRQRHAAQLREAREGMPTPDQVDAVAALVAEAMTSLNAIVQVITEATDGYRASCTARGYCDAVAEAMALKYHDFALATLMPGRAASSS